ncbi:hypothetical protein CAEBREN_11195 [Caenorhabditis brenneri]|uniref:DDE Tnp4 domain-containing protein n=1 Tax=Caenorhabditis brenneri TaxID=135651 RepID=G0MUP1_CAEBE|nr:hypothetical protein CAEBREN_11195 [Caenorhabditis brenneri]
MSTLSARDRKVINLAILQLLRKKKMILNAAVRWVNEDMRNREDQKSFKNDNLRHFVKLCNRLEDKEDAECRKFTFIPKQIVDEVKKSFELEYTANNFKLSSFQMTILFLQFVAGGTPGSVNDATIFNQSQLKQLLEDGSSLPPPKYWSEQVVMPSFIVGDGIFPLLTNLMKPYSRRNLTTEEAVFNRVLSNARVKMEHAFGMQSGKFRCMRRELECSYDKSVEVVISLCNLHNLILSMRTTRSSRTDELDEAPVNPYANPKEQREALKYLLNEP